MYIEFEKLNNRFNVGDIIIIHEWQNGDFHSRDKEIFEMIKDKKVIIENIERNDVTCTSLRIRYEGYDLLIKYEDKTYKIHTLNIGKFDIINTDTNNNNINVTISSLLNEIKDASLQGILREVIFNKCDINLTEDDLKVIISKHRPEENI